MDNAEAGPSGTSGPATSTNSHPYTTAPLLPIPSSTYYTIEYPGLLRSPSSLPQALTTLGGQDALDAAFRRTAALRPIELSFRPGEPFAQPVQGEVLDFKGLVVKVTKRRRKRKRGEQDGDERVEGETNGGGKEREDDGGVYTTEVVGVTRKVARFRSMADFAYAPPQPDPILDLRRALSSMDSKFLTTYQFPSEKEDYILYPPGSSIEPSTPSARKSASLSLDPGQPMPISNMRLLPPPRFTKTVVPQLYSYRQNVSAVPTATVDPETGEERMRYQNRFKPTSDRVAAVAYDEKDVPAHEPPGVDKLDRMAYALLEKLRGLFEQRPVWSRLALRNQLTEAEDHMLMNARSLFVYIGYMFSDGPWRDFHIRWGYDPRLHPEARVYQRMQFRNFENTHSRPTALLLKKPVQEGPEERNTMSHIFDGKTLGRNVANFQLCDMTDPLLQRFVNDPAAVGTECHPIHGWYTSEAWDRIRAIARRKFTPLLSGLPPITDAECTDLLGLDLRRDVVQAELRTLSEARKLRELREKGLVSRAKGHNLALGPMAPEDEAAERLRKRLEAARAREAEEEDEMD